MVTQVNNDFLNNGNAKRTLAKLEKVITPIAEKDQLLSKLMTNLEDLSATLSKNPDYGDQVLETLNELTVTMKALQRTWMLSDHANEIQSESSKIAH